MVTIKICHQCGKSFIDTTKKQAMEYHSSNCSHAHYLGRKRPAFFVVIEVTHDLRAVWEYLGYDISKLRDRDEQ